MSDTLESLRRKKESASKLGSVVRAMKAMAASNIGQYEQAVIALQDYHRTVSLGVSAYFNQQKNIPAADKKIAKSEKFICAVVFGSDQGLVGGFNDQLADFAKQKLDNMPGKKEVWAVGEKIYLRLADIGLNTARLFSVPNSVGAITPLTGKILIKSQERLDKKQDDELYIFHNSPAGSQYQPFCERLFPLDEKWKEVLAEPKWQTNNLPQVVGDAEATLSALIREYLFVSLFKASAESLASENASRLEAMQRAEKNIGEMQDDLNQRYHRLRQSTIDEELFDVIAGFEALEKR